MKIEADTLKFVSNVRIIGFFTKLSNSQREKAKTENPIENSMIEHIQRFSRILLFFSYFDFVHFRQFRCFNDDDS